MTGNLTHGYDLVQEISESTINTLVGITGALPTDLSVPFDGDVLPGTRATGTATLHLVPPDMAPGSLRLDAPIDDGVLLDVSFYNGTIELTAPKRCSITSLVGRVFVIAAIDVVAPRTDPDHRYLAVTRFLRCTVIPEGGSRGHIDDMLRDCGIADFSGRDLVRFLARTIQRYLEAILDSEGYLPLHGDPIVVNPGSTDPFEPQEIDVRVVNETRLDPGLERDALALLVTTLGDGGDPTPFGSTSFLSAAEGGSAAIGNFFFLRHIVRPLIIDALGIPAAEVGEHFDPGHPCHLTHYWRQTEDVDTRFDGEVEIDVEEVEVNPDDGGFFSVHLEADAAFRFQIGRSMIEVGGADGTLDGTLHVDLVGNQIRPRLSLTPRVRAYVDRRARIGIVMSLWLTPHLIPVFEGTVKYLEDLVEERITDLINGVLAQLNSRIPSVDTERFFAWLSPYGIEFTPASVAIDDILVSGSLSHARRTIAPSREGHGLDLPTGWSFDLDGGEMLEPDAPDVHPDFAWDRSGGKKCIVPIEAGIAYLGRRVSFTEINRDDLRGLHYETDHTIFEGMLPIVPDDQPVDVETGGTVFAVETSRGGHAKVRVIPMHRSSTDLTFDFVYWEPA